MWLRRGNLRTCLSHVGFNVSFVDIHKINSKCTPQQIMLYQIALNLHKFLNSDLPLTFEKISLFDQMVCGRRQSKFEILRNFQGKIGMNTMANKFYHISKLIGLDQLNLGFVHFKKLAKIQFLKNGNTWAHDPLCQKLSVLLLTAKFLYVIVYIYSCHQWYC